MDTPSTYIKTEPELKAKAEEAAKQLGVNLSAVVNEFLRGFIRTKKMKTDDPGYKPTPYLKRVIRQAEKDLKAGKGSPTFNTAEEAIAYLEKQGV